jgi:prepilin-type N-terminal cleavage/methylation domain-containing protein
MMSIINKIKFPINNNQKGMTLIELLVVIAIMTILSGITIFDYTSFRSSISVENLANDIALSIRKAQSHAIGVKGVGSDFSYAQGIHFSTDTEKYFIIFNDSASPGNNNKFDGSGETCGGECREKLTIDTMAKISGFYIGTDQAIKSGKLNILFKRPNPDANFCYISSGNNCSGSNIPSAKIVVSNGLTGNKEIIRFVNVWNTGQISVTKD